MKHEPIYKLAVAFISFLCCLQVNAQDLKKHRWEHRVLIVKISSVNLKEAQTQFKEINKSIEGMIERKLVLYTIVNDEFMFTNYETCKLNDAGKISEKMKKMLNPKEDFEVLLIGLDGGVKLQQTKVITQKALFDKIDSMPMRSNELRKKQNNN